MGSCLSDESRSPRAGSPMGVRKRKSMKKRLGSQNSFDYRREERLHRTPGRMFLNGSTEIASLFTQQGRKGTNQDAMIVWENFGSRTDTVFCGVFDGHGPYGHMVAKRVRDSLPLRLSSHWEVNIKSDGVLREVSLNSVATCSSFGSEGTSFVSADDEASRASVDVEENGKHRPEFFETLKESFLKAFKFMDRELRMHANIDCFCSGTTAVTLVKQGQDLVIGNIGDSRAILATRDENDLLTAVQLTVDLKPNLPAEAERIRKCKGRVFSLQDEPDVSRVWLPHNDSPGLAMARAFGDFCLKDFGLISVPEISYRRITDKDEFIVLASDGTAVKAWRSKYPTSKVDDCAVVCLFLDSNESNSATTKSKENIPSVEQDDDVSPKDEVIGEGNEDFSEATEECSDEEHVNVEVGQDWSALEGVSRVNTLVNLPRFKPGVEDEKAAAEKRARK
ncbi:probable protein phosphatase 2c 33 [Phtheirospermum japonicum]|uniref:Probable protein phosphatase 2c 33 n=1 Tax=Phtheirospermum japonicum TaxID=374723 RepID=A0A830D1Z4_9LAMI|nr:probable protein phosphatase 2c 33 [Phtheirospermum japonicum]